MTVHTGRYNTKGAAAYLLLGMLEPSIPKATFRHFKEVSMGGRIPSSI